MDIRSFFGPPSGGGGSGGGSTKAKTPPSGKTGKGKSISGERSKSEVANNAPGKRGTKSNPAGGNKGPGERSAESASKKSVKTPTRERASSRGGRGESIGEDEDDAVEILPRPGKKTTASPGQKRKGRAKANDSSSNSSDDDGSVEVVPSPSKSRSTGAAAAAASSPGARKKGTSRAADATNVGQREAVAAGKAKGSPSPVSKKKKAAVTPSAERGGTRRRASKAVNYKEDEDEEGDGGDDDDDDNFSEKDAQDDESEDAAASDEESSSDEEEEDAFDDTVSRKRKSASSSSSTKVSKKVGGGAGSGGGGGGRRSSTDSKKKRTVIEDSDDDDDEGGDAADDQPPTSSKHFSSTSTASRRAKPEPAKEQASGKSNKKKQEVVELGGTSSEEEEEKELTPPPRKKPAAAARAKPSPAASAGGDSAKKKSGGGGGFRPPWLGGGRKAPPNEGKKETPVGAEQCLAGKAFVVSGVLDSLGREAAEDLVKQYGGKVTGSVSSKTTYLLLGTVLDDGRPPEDGSKYKKAKQLNTKIIDEDDLFKMLRDSNPQGKAAAAAPAPAPAAAPAATSKPTIVNPYLSKGAVVNPYASQANSKKPSGGVVNPYGAGLAGGAGGRAKSGGNSPAAPLASGSPAAATAAAAAAATSQGAQMWVDKYKPRTSSEVIGHAGQVKKLKVWLQNWERWHLGSSGVKPPMGKDNPGARAALLSGVPGVGKSSTATLVAREMGYHVTELNASDTRNKSSLSMELADVIGNQVLSFKPDGPKSGGSNGGAAGGGGFKKQLVIMDEVDGMGGSDRGGIQELILLIKKSKVPIIAICNDRQHQKIRSLVNYCYDLRFSRPQKATIAKRVKAVAKMEGLDVDENAAEMLVEANGNDIRQVLHALQMWSRKSSKMTYMNLKGGLASIEKDKVQRMGPFDAARSILGGASRTPFRERFEAFFTDYSLLPLLVHQNYLSSLMNVDPKTRVDVTAAASAAVSDADIISGKMRGDVQHWELLPAQAALNVRVGSIGGGSLGFPEFPKWLGNYSRENKRRRLLGELSTHLNASISGGTEAVRLSYIPFMKTALTQPLVDAGADGAPACVALLEEYGMSRDDLFEVIPEFKLSTKGMRSPPPDVFASLDTKTKSAVTRCYNALSHKSQALVETLQAPKKAKKRKAPPRSLDMEEEGDENGEGEESEEEEDDDLSAFKKKKGKSRASPSTSGKGKAAPKPRAKKSKGK